MCLLLVISTTRDSCPRDRVIFLKRLAQAWQVAEGVGGSPQRSSDASQQRQRGASRARQREAPRARHRARGTPTHARAPCYLLSHPSTTALVALTQAKKRAEAAAYSARLSKLIGRRVLDHWLEGREYVTGQANAQWYTPSPPYAPPPPVAVHL